MRSQLSQRSQRSQRDLEQNSEFPWADAGNYGGRPSIRIRRTSLSAQNQDAGPSQSPQMSGGGSVRRNRSISEPQRGQVPTTPRLNTQQPYMPRMSEEVSSPDAQAIRDEVLPIPPTVPEESTPPARPSSSGKDSRQSRWRPLRRARSNIASNEPPPNSRQDEYDANLVDLLDLVGMLRERVQLQKLTWIRS